MVVACLFAGVASRDLVCLQVSTFCCTRVIGFAARSWPKASQNLPHQACPVVVFFAPASIERGGGEVARVEATIE